MTGRVDRALVRLDERPLATRFGDFRLRYLAAWTRLLGTAYRGEKNQ